MHAADRNGQPHSLWRGLKCNFSLVFICSLVDTCAPPFHQTVNPGKNLSFTNFTLFRCELAIWGVLRIRISSTCNSLLFLMQQKGQQPNYFWGNMSAGRTSNLNNLLYTPYISRGFYFREFRESGASREFNNTRKYLPPIRTHECDLCTPPRSRI